MTTRRDSFAVVARILICLAVMCVVALGVARDSTAVPLPAGHPFLNVHFTADDDLTLGSRQPFRPPILESWDDQINNPTRFKELPEFNNEAVLDRETQFVWQRVEELASLTDTTLTAPALLYWTNTSYLSGTVFVAYFGATCRASEVQRTVFVVPNTFSLLQWCVRAGQGPHILR
jgi:hypothetical protein